MQLFCLISCRQHCNRRFETISFQTSRIFRMLDTNKIRHCSSEYEYESLIWHLDCHDKKIVHNSLSDFLHANASFWYIALISSHFSISLIWAFISFYMRLTHLWWYWEDLQHQSRMYFFQLRQCCLNSSR